MLLLSGTPFGASKEKLKGWFPIILGVDKDSDIQPLNDLNDAADQYEIALKKLHKATDDTSLQARRHLQDASVKYTNAIAPYMIRRLKASSWGTGRVSPLQKPKVQIIPIRLSSEDATKAKQREVQLLDQLEKRPENASGAIMTPEERKQLASAIHSSTRRAIQDNMWPSLLDLESKGLVPDVTSDYTPTRIWSKITELDLLEPSSGNRFFNNVASIAHASSKCQYILNKIESLETLPNGAHEKILIGSFDAFNAWLLYLVLNKEYGPKGVLWIHSKHPSSERAQIADRFQEPYSRSNPARVLVAPIDLINSGLDFHL